MTTRKNRPKGRFFENCLFTCLLPGATVSSSRWVDQGEDFGAGLAWLHAGRRGNLHLLDTDKTLPRNLSDSLKFFFSLYGFSAEVYFSHVCSACWVRWYLSLGPSFFWAVMPLLNLPLCNIVKYINPPTYFLAFSWLFLTAMV